MQVELTERYGLQMAHILATGATLRLHQDMLHVAFAHGYADPDAAAMPASHPEPRHPSTGRGAADEITQAYASHGRKFAVPDVEAGRSTAPATSHRGLRQRSVEDIGAATRAFASHPAASHPAASQSS